MRLVLAGGGHAQLAVLAALRRQQRPDLSVTLVSPEPEQIYSGMLPGWMAGHYKLSQCLLPLAPLAEAAGVRFRIGRLVRVAADARRVQLDDGEWLDYDRLSLDVGSMTDITPWQACAARMVPLRPLTGLLTAWPQIRARAAAGQVLRLAVVGGGAAGIELALAARHAFDSLAAAAAQVDLVHAPDGLIPGHGQRIRERAQALLVQHGIRLHAARAAGDAGGLLLTPGGVLAADHVLIATGGEAPNWLADSGLALAGDGRVRVDQHHRSLSHPEVFAAGDVCAREDVQLAHSGVHAVMAGPVLAHNLLATAGQSLRSYRPRRHSLYLLATGPRQALLSWGGWSAHGRWIWYWKDAIDRAFMRRHRHSSVLTAPL